MKFDAHNYKNPKGKNKCHIKCLFHPVNVIIVANNGSILIENQDEIGVRSLRREFS